jgi:hypothetical protein
VVTLSNHDQVVQIAKVLMVVREQDAISLNGMGEMNGIVIAAQTDIRRHLDVVARLSEQPN